MSSSGSNRPFWVRKVLPASLILCSIGFITASAMSGPNEVPAQQQDLDRELQRSVKKHFDDLCLPCHSDDAPAGDISFSGLSSVESVTADRETYARALSMIRASIMPPDGSKMPSNKQFDQMVEWLDEALIADCELVDPGRVTIRRLNRLEYNNTIRDLLKLEGDHAAAFPSDDVGHGFDNIGDVLTLSTLHLEKLADQAEALAEQAIEVSSFEEKLYSVDDMVVEGSANKREFGVHFFSRGTAVINHKVKEAGAYRVRIVAWAQQAGPESAKMSVAAGPARPITFTVKAEQGKPGVYEFPLDITTKTLQIQASFINDFYDPKVKDPKRRDRNLALESIEILGPFESGKEKSESHLAVIPRRPLAGQEEAAAKGQLGDFASRAFRRPATLNEIDRLYQVFEAGMEIGGSYEHGMRAGVAACLISPSFLFRIELDSATSNSETALNGFELASRLSYFLWSTMPDETLFELAGSGELTKPDVLTAQVERMLKDRKANTLAESFGRQWLQIGIIQDHAPDPDLFPGFTEELRQDMLDESRLFFVDIMRADRPVTDFIEADWTFLNQRLAAHYGIPGVQGRSFRRVKVGELGRGGILTQGAVLTVTSNPNRTSPVKRGRWILEQVLGTPPPPPPPGTPSIEKEDEEANELTFREKLVKHREDPACASCHRLMDPLGFGLENFDAVGRWRTEAEDGEVDSSGVLPNGVKFEGPGELRTILAGRKREFVFSLSQNMMTFALGRGMRADDICFVAKVVDRTEKNGYKFSEMVKAIVLSDAFRKRSRRSIQ